MKETMSYSESRQDISASVKEQTDIVSIIGEHVELKRSGVRHLGLCPFHGEKTPSFSVNAAQQFFYCFGCGESGDVFSFLMKLHNLDFQSALEQLADRLNIVLPPKRMSEKQRKRAVIQEGMYAVTAKAATLYRQFLLQENGAEGARQYLAKRGIPEEIQKRFEIGYAPPKRLVGWNFLARQLTPEEASMAELVGLLVRGDRGGRYDRFRDRVLFPLHDAKGRICGFGGRIIGDGQPKYMNSPESDIFSKSRNLLGLFQQSEEIRKKNKAIIVEGNFDMVSLVVHGCTNVVAPLGTALTTAQIRTLRKYAEQIVLLFDGDEAGKKAALRTAPLFLAEKLHAKVALLPQGQDPDTFIRERGVRSLNELMSQAKELPEFVLDELINEHGLTLEGKSKIAEEINPLIRAAPSDLQRSVIIAHFAEKLGVEAAQLRLSVQSRAPSSSESKLSNFARTGGQKSAKLSTVQKRLVEFMVMYPCYFEQLEKKNIRGALQGSMGEILFLQMQMLLAHNNEVQPEEILSALPEGPERDFVAGILLGASQIDASTEGDQCHQKELEEMLDWLDVQTMRGISDELSAKIQESQHNNDFQALQKLLEQKQKVETKLRRIKE